LPPQIFGVQDAVVDGGMRAFGMLSSQAAPGIKTTAMVKSEESERTENMETR